MKSPLVFWAGSLVAGSAALFVAFELINHIKIAWGAYKIGSVEKRFFRLWAFFFAPAVLLAVAGAALLLYLFLCNLAV